MSETGLHGGRVVVTTGDITLMKVDAIVNAANSSLMGGGGVDGAIHRAGGPAILEECRRLRGGKYPDGLPAGEAVETTGGRLAARFVIHTVGPVWRGGSSGETAVLAQCYTKSLALAGRLGVSTLAIPAISTGIYGYPRELAARTAWDAVTAFLESHDLPRTVSLVFYSADDARVFLSRVPPAP
jgi:O-acetyl-ADP-ribose deacetylase